MRTVAERRIAGVLALAEKRFAGFVRFKFHRRKVRALVASVAKGLVAGVAAGTKKVGFALFQFHTGGLLGCNFRIAHIVSLRVEPEQVTCFFNLLTVLWLFRVNFRRNPVAPKLVRHGQWRRELTWTGMFL